MNFSPLSLPVWFVLLTVAGEMHTVAQQPVAPPVPAAPMRGVDSWLQRYDVAWKGASDPGADHQDRNLISVHVRLLTPPEESLLRELANWEPADRLKLLGLLLEAAKTRQDLPIEYACHAATQGDEALRTRIWTELLEPRLAKVNLSAAEQEIVLRAVAELELQTRKPGLTTRLVEFLLASEPVSASGKPTSRESAQQTSFYRLLKSVAAHTPQAERDTVSKMLGYVRPEPTTLEALIEWEPRPFVVDIVRTIQDRNDWRSRFEPPPIVPADKLAQLRAPQTPPTEFLGLLRTPGFERKLLTAEEQRELVARIVQNAPKLGIMSLGQLYVELAGKNLAMDPADRVALLALPGKLPGSQRSELDGGSRWLLERTPPDELIEVLPKLAEEAPEFLHQVNAAMFAELSAAQAQELIRRLIPKVLAGERAVLTAYALAANRLEPAERQKSHELLFTQMTKCAAEPPPRTRFDRSPDPLGDYAIALGLCKELAHQTIEQALKLTYDSPTVSGQVGAAVKRFGEPGLSGLLRQLPADQMEPWLPRLTAELNHSESRQTILTLIGNLSSQLTPAQAKALAPVVIPCAALPTSSHPTNHLSVARFIVGRPLNERVDLLKVLAQVIFQSAYKTTREPAPPGFFTSQPLLLHVLRDLPPQDAAELAPYVLELQAKSTNVDPVTTQFVSALLRKLPVEDSSKEVGVWARGQLQNDPTPLQVARVALVNKFAPRALDAASRERLFQLLAAHAAAILKPDLAISGKPGANEIIKSAAEYLPALVKSLPESQTRGPLESLIDPLTQFTPGTFTEQRGGGDMSFFSTLLPVLAAAPYPLSSDKVTRLAHAYLRFALHEHPARLQKALTSMLQIRGTLPAGEGKELCDELLKWHQAQRTQRTERRPEELTKLLLVVASLMPADDVTHCVAMVETLLPLDPQSKQPDRSRTGRDADVFGSVDWIYSQLIDEMPAKVAEDRIRELAKLSEQTGAADPARQEALKKLIRKLMQPVGRDNPARLLALIKVYPPNDPQSLLASSYLQAKNDISELLLAELQQMGDLKDSPSKLGSALILMRPADPATRLKMLGTLTNSGVDPFVIAASCKNDHRRPGFDRQALSTLLRKVENVGLRRYLIDPPPFDDKEYLTRWQLLQTVK